MVSPKRFTFFVALAAFTLYSLQVPDLEMPIEGVETALGGKPLDMQTVAVSSPRALLQPNDTYHFGRYRTPVSFPELHYLTLAQHLFVKKSWMFMSFTAGNYLVGIAVADMGYVRSGLAYVYHAKSGGFDRVSTLLPVGMGASVAPSSLSGCSTWSSMVSSALRIDICRVDKAWKVSVVGKLDQGTQLTIDGIVSGTDDQFAMNFPIGPNRPAYTHKCAAMSVLGTLKIESPPSPMRAASLALSPENLGLGLLDFTKAMHRRVTLWWWAALSVRTKSGNRLGLQLSTGVYQDKQGNDLENAVWLDGVMHVLSEKISWQGHPGKGDLEADKDFAIEGESIHLSFRGRAAMENEIRSYPVADGNLRHWFGTYSGTIQIGDKSFEVESSPGILEDHYAMW